MGVLSELLLKWRIKNATILRLYPFVCCLRAQELIVTTTQEPPMDMAAFGNIQLSVDADEPRGGEREIMPCDLGPTIVGNRGTVWGTLWPDGLDGYYDFEASISQLNRFRTREAMACS